MKYVVCEKAPIGGYRVMGCHAPYLSRIEEFNNIKDAEAFMNGLKKEKPDSVFCIETIKSYL